MFHRFRIYLLYVAGFFFLGLGIAGYILPGLPGTVFLILAASCFLRSNEKMYRWVTEHKVFGKGKVLNIEGVDENSKLTIKFYNNVTKKLILKYANLKLIDTL